MTLSAYMMEQISIAQNVDFFVRFLVACLCGAAIGFERSKRFKEAGIRTHIIVCCAAALMMIVSKYGFTDLTDPAGNDFFGVKGADPSRIASQVISGVSFLGAGIIFRNGTSIRGLTTAAGIWATAGIGLAIGAGMFVIGIFATIVIAFIQVIMHRFVLSSDLLVLGQIHCKVLYPDKFRVAMNEFVEKNKLQVVTAKVAVNEDGSSNYDLVFRINPKITMNDLSSFLESNEGVKEIRCELGK